MEWWQKVEDKTPPKTDADWVLCAWARGVGSRPPHYEVLLHWPDGAWTGTGEQELCAEEMPDWWVSIKPPNVELTGKAGLPDLSGRTQG